MASTRPNPLDDPLAVSSDEEHLHDAEEVDTDDDKGSGSESESSSEDEVPKEDSKKTLPQLPEHLPKNPNSYSGDETDSENETVGSPVLSGFTIHKHGVTSPDPVKTKKPVLKRPPSEGTKKPVLKRPPSSEGTKKDSRAKKTKIDNGEKEVKKSTIQLWSDEDTVALLELILAFIEKKGADPLADGGIVFHDYVKGKLSFETSTPKLLEKIRRLKKKFLKMGEEGEDPEFPKPIDEKSWNLSKRIWGQAGVVLALQAKNLSSKRSTSKKKTKDNVNGGLIICSNGENVATRQLPLVTEKTDVKAGKKTVVTSEVPLATEKKTVVTSELPLPTEKTNGKDEAVVSRHMQENTDANVREFSKVYPYLCHSLKDGNAHKSLVSKDWLELMEGSLCQLEKSKLEELEGEWRKHILGEIEFRASILLKQVGMVKDLHLQRGN